MKSGSKKGGRGGAGRPPELSEWQASVLEGVAGSPVARDATFGGATALSLVHLHHRRSEDVDFFFMEPATARHVGAVEKIGRRLGYGVEVNALATRWSLVFRQGARAVGHVDLAHYPYEAVSAPTRWKGLRVDSLLDMAVNKVQAMLSRARGRDFVDLYFLLREGPERDLRKLFFLARAKFEFGPNPIALAESLLRVESVADLPEMLRPVDLDEIKAFFLDLARQIVRRGPQAGGE